MVYFCKLSANLLHVSYCCRGSTNIHLSRKYLRNIITEDDICVLYLIIFNCEGNSEINTRNFTPSGRCRHFMKLGQMSRTLTAYRETKQQFRAAELLDITRTSLYANPQWSKSIYHTKSMRNRRQDDNS